MANMVDIKPKKGKKGEISGSSYGHRIRVENDHVDDLGMSNLKVGDMVHVRAHGKVTSVGAHEDESEYPGYPGAPGQKEKKAKTRKTRHVEITLHKMAADKRGKADGSEAGSAKEAVDDALSDMDTGANE